MTELENLTAPFPYFGGKRKAAPVVWEAFGTVQNYVEPFAGSLAMLLASPTPPGIETVNDFDGFIVNFWRSIRADAEAVARWADWPVSEIDLEARHGWLVNRSERLKWSLADPDFYDAKIAGWWVWGQCAWIGSGWCFGEGPWHSNGAEISDQDNGGKPINRGRPHLGNAGKGINRSRPHLGDAGKGINRATETDRAEFIRDWFTKLQRRIRDVRITCGDWSRVCGPAVTTNNGITAVFLDPPYSAGGVDRSIYKKFDDVAKDVRHWCAEQGDNPLLRIALCGYADEHELPGWTSLTTAGITKGGYGNQAKNGLKKNNHRETIWFSPHCHWGEFNLFAT